MEGILIKFFEKPEFIKEFRTGHIRLMSTSNYVPSDFSKDLYDNRDDLTEGVSYMIHKEKSKDDKIIDLQNGWNLKLKSDIQVEKAVFNYLQTNNQLKITCFYYINNNLCGDLKPILDTMQDSLGEYFILFINPGEFQNRFVKKAQELGNKKIVKRYKMAPVTYYDPNTRNGITSPFEKPNGLEWQREFRALVETLNETDPFYMDIGDITDITVWGNKSDLENACIDDKYGITLKYRID